MVAGVDWSGREARGRIRGRKVGEEIKPGSAKSRSDLGEQLGKEIWGSFFSDFGWEIRAPRLGLAHVKRELEAAVGALAGSTDSVSISDQFCRLEVAGSLS